MWRPEAWNQYESFRWYNHLEVAYGNDQDTFRKNGRVVIPAQFRKALGILEGDTLMMTLDDGMIRILTPQKAIQRVQEMVRRYVPEGVSLADELIAERRAEAARE